MSLNSLNFYPSEVVQTGISSFTRQGEAATCINPGLFLDDLGTIAGYGRGVPVAGTSSGELQTATAVLQDPARGGAPAILKLRRLSGLTFEELAALLGV